MAPSKLHDWKTVVVHEDDPCGLYDEAKPQEVVDHLYAIENQGWEIFAVYTRYGNPVIICRRPFVPALMREGE